MLFLVMQLHVLVNILKQFNDCYVLVFIAICLTLQSLDNTVGEEARTDKRTFSRIFVSARREKDYISWVGL